jgi:hypothetical protein
VGRFVGRLVGGGVGVRKPGQSLGRPGVPLRPNVPYTEDPGHQLAPSALSFEALCKAMDTLSRGSCLEAKEIWLFQVTRSMRTPFAPFNMIESPPVNKLQFGST